ncbi:MAG: hypothetical protein CL678_17075 [Bdellovibrionaceae bacterium]|nr:hypothetical protein [Pseudobdellovibrionaceae bacterium]|tara:strand:- start:7100 stop:8527 length:1428 start_codon:yes stop_codon:yes gene_type:complete
MNFDLDTKNYNKEDYFDIFNLDKNMNVTPSTVNTKFKELLNDIESSVMEKKEKEQIKVFLKESKRNLLNILMNEEDNYKLVNSSFFPDLNKSETYNVGGHYVIKKNGSDENQTGKLNPFAKTQITKLLNINTRFRPQYYDTQSTDCVITLPETFKNVISLTVVNVQLPNSNYTFSSKIGTNEFSVELYDELKPPAEWQKAWDNGGRLEPDEGGQIGGQTPGYPDALSNNLKIIRNHEKKTIRISDGIYSGNILEDYLNTHVLTQDTKLHRIACKYDEISRKFRFFRDYRKLDNGGAGSEEGDLSGNFYNLRFNIDWRSQTDLDRPAQLNMGWLLGYRQQYYNWDEDYTDSSGVTYEKQEGYNPEAVYDNLGTRYFILSIDDYNKNYSSTLISPFQESVFTDQTAIAKVPNTPDLINFDDILYQSRRNYFGPVNIKRLHIKLYDELGRIVDLNNNDFSLSIQLEQLYDPHINKIYT